MAPPPSWAHTPGREEVNLRNLIKHFVREAPGIWTCIEAAELQLPQGRVQVSVGMRFTYGDKFMGVELAKLLEEQYERGGSDL